MDWNLNLGVTGDGGQRGRGRGGEGGSGGGQVLEVVEMVLGSVKSEGGGEEVGYRLHSWAAILVGRYGLGAILGSGAWLLSLFRQGTVQA
jgi:hypothetical protein